MRAWSGQRGVVSVVMMSKYESLLESRVARQRRTFTSDLLSVTAWRLLIIRVHTDDRLANPDEIDDLDAP